ncbi:hypothetical protein TMEN_1450 [Trichophyton mentagrophytes]|nr:hypothetical protein TMEN_1450 [Trichophyton mentagrophytes]
MGSPSLSRKGDTPPRPLTLTIAGVAALFVPDAPICTGVSVNTAYASPRVPDPSPVILKRWMAPTRRETDLILKSLARLCNVKAINWFGLYCYIELHTDDGRSYKRHSLPGLVAGKTTTYHHSVHRFWDEPENLGLIRRIDSRVSAAISPLQDYSTFGPVGGRLTDGIRGAPIVKEVSSRTADSGGDVCGMFCSGDEFIAMAPVLDDIIEAGWELY